MDSRQLKIFFGELGERRKNFLFRDRRVGISRNLQMVYDVSTTLMETSDLREICEKMMDSLFSCMKRIDGAAILFANSTNLHIKKVVAKSRDKGNGIDKDITEIIARRVVGNGEVIMMADVESENGDVFAELLKKNEIKSFISIPLIKRSKVGGALCIHSSREPNGFRKDDLFLLASLASPLAIAIENALLHALQKVLRQKIRRAQNITEVEVASRTKQLSKTNETLKQEIAQLRQEEQMLSQREAQYRSLVENSLDGFYVYEIPSGRFLFFHQRACDLFGYTMEQALELSIWDIIVPEEHEKIRKMMLAGTRGDPPQSGREVYTALRKDGSTFQAELSQTRITNQKNYVVQGIIRGITRIRDKKAGELQDIQSLDSLGIITEGVAHNFRDMLAGISLNNQLVQLNFKENHEIRKITERTNRIIERGAHLVKELTKFSGKQTRPFEEIDLSKVIREVHEISRGAFGNRIRIHLDTPNSFRIMGDRSALIQAFANLCSNADDAMPQGGELWLTLEKEGDAAAVTIRDTGVGMDKNIIDKCFDPFFTTKYEEKRMGLGLSTVYGVIKAHGGEIEVDSHLNKGTTFKIFLPLAAEKEDRERLDTDEYVRSEGQKIMVVDDEIEMLEPIEELLEGLGYRVKCVTSGEAAVVEYKRWQPGAVLLDRDMPLMDGMQCAKMISEHDPDAKIIMVSGYEKNGSNPIDERTRSIIKGYITKPFEMADLIQGLEEVLA